MAATTVNDFYLKYVKTPPDEAKLLRLSKRFTIMWGIVQLVVALGAQWLDQSVLDAGLSVLSLTTGPVLGAFLVGVFTRRVGAAAMIAGMSVGALVLFTLWSNGSVGWTWYALIGSSVTAASALAASLVVPSETRAAL
jgi:Na+/proline symporter